MKVAVYALARNEIANVERWEASCREADVRVVTDTGSTDGTVEALESAGVTVRHGNVIPWRWDDGHNLSLMNVPADVDVCIRLDLDEELVAGWREALEEAWVEGTTKLRYWYHWSEEVRFLCDRVHTRDGYRWQSATHEGLVRWHGEEVQARSDKFTIRHHREPNKTHSTDLTLLRQAVRENPTDARIQWYLARQLHYGDDAECVEAFMRYLRMPGGNPSERAYALRVLAAREPAKRNRHMLGAMLEAPHEPESYLAVAEMAYRMQDPVATLYFARQALACHPDGRTHASEPRAYGAFPADLAFSAAWNLGLHDEARRHLAEAAKRDPADERIAANVAAIERMEIETGPKET
jgi:tetratricopeptide (TPR) repeat protein